MRIALLTNFIPPYRISLYQEIERRCSAFGIFLSAKTEEGRHWEPQWGSLPVRIQRNISIRRRWKHPHSFTEFHTVHIPYDTVFELARFRPDVVLSAELGLRTAQAALYCLLARRPKLIIWTALSDVTEQGRGTLRRLLRSVLLRSADAVLVNGQGGARYVRSFGVSPIQTFIVPYATDLNPFLAQPATRGQHCRRRLLYSGSLTERKGILPFLAVVSRWATNHSDYNLELHILGQGPLKEAISKLTLPSNLRVSLLGSASYEQLANVYKNAGVLAFPTLADEWGMVVTEAMACGMPVLGSTYSQAVEELVTDGLNGWVFRPDHESEIYQALDRMLHSSIEHLNEMGHKARDRARTITPQTATDQIMAAISRAQAVPA